MVESFDSIDESSLLFRSDKPKKLSENAAFPYHKVWHVRCSTHIDFKEKHLKGGNREFSFEFNRADIQASDTSKVSEIAAYMKQNPSLRIGIDGSMDPRGTDPRNQDLSDRRISAVRDALIQAGVPASKIQSGAYGDAKLARDRRVEVLISSSK